MSEADPIRYTLAWEDAAVDRLAALVKQYPEAAQGVIPAIYELADNPRPTGLTQLGGSGTYAARVDRPRRVGGVVPDATETPAAPPDRHARHTAALAPAHGNEKSGPSRDHQDDHRLAANSSS